MKKSLAPKRTRTRTPNNRTTTGFRISDALWAVLAPLLPVRVNTHRFGGGRPRVPDRCCADAIFYVLRTGCQWEALNQTELCAKSTAHDRFQAWVAAGVFLQLWRAGVERFDELQGIDWHWLSMDGARPERDTVPAEVSAIPTLVAVRGILRDFAVRAWHGGAG